MVSDEDKSIYINCKLITPGEPPRPLLHHLLPAVHAVSFRCETMSLISLVMMGTAGCRSRLVAIVQRWYRCDK